MTPLSVIRPKLQQLIRLMGSDNDGEALNALRMAGRTLASAGADFHDLANALEPDVKGEAIGFGDEFWIRPKPKRGNDDFVPPKRRRPPPRASGPPLWEKMEKTTRLAWLDALIRCETVTAHQKTIVAAVRARYYSQPHVEMKPARCAEINCIFAEAWIADVRPVADVLPGDNRLPLMWTGQNRDPVKRVLRAAAPYLPYKDGVFANSVATRLDAGPQTLAMLSTEEVERIDRLLVASYDLGARP